jgi:membrane protease YdiL (CAAX protease family)
MTVVVAALALANSLSEELLWRVALWRPATGVTLTLLAQALSFGVAHAGGLPGGPMGMAAAAVYSGVLAGLRWRYGFSVAVTPTPPERSGTSHPCAASARLSP